MSEHVIRPPCRECPWVVATPPGQFPTSRYEALRHTTGSPGNDRPYGTPMFACHKAPEGEEFYCAGWLASVGYYNITARVLVAHGRLTGDEFKPGPDWPELYPSYEALMRVHGGPT